MIITSVLVAGGAGLFAWVFASQLTTPGFAWLQKWLRRGWRRPLVSCPWCSGFWLCAIFAIALQWGYLHPVITPLSALAAAAIVGYIGSLTPGINDEEDDAE